MKTNKFFSLLFSFVISICNCTYPGDKNSQEQSPSLSLTLPLKSTKLLNEILNDQIAIETINQVRPQIYLYTDFGGGSTSSVLVSDVQTSAEIASAAWKTTLQQELLINDSAAPLLPKKASVCLAKTFPYTPSQLKDNSLPPIEKIVVHVIDPGVGNDQQTKTPQPRSLVLRKDGILFIGPDNGSLTFTCPQESIAGIWEIVPDQLHALCKINVDAGGTFHGRDLFSEAAFRIASGTASPNQIGKTYLNQDLINKFTIDDELEKWFIEVKDPLKFSKVSTERFIGHFETLDDKKSFEIAFLLGIIQSPLYITREKAALTDAKKLFFITTGDKTSSHIAVINYKTGNIFVGENNGLATSFFKGYSKLDIAVHCISDEVLKILLNEKNNQSACLLIEQQPLFTSGLKEIFFLGDEGDIKRDSKGRIVNVSGKIWIDQYGNIKTTIKSHFLQELAQHRVIIKAQINEVTQPIILAKTFSEVPKEQLFIYSGSTAAIGENPFRSERYLELTSNGIFGKFGTDFFEKKGIKVQSGDSIMFSFDYE